jgi:lysophospholipase L1-like esterase
LNTEKIATTDKSSHFQKQAITMEQILVYSDSLSWGIIPETRHRLAFAKRWPGVFENALIEAGQHVRVIEDCLNGRRTVFDDPIKAGRNGAKGLAQVIEMHSPLKLVVLMLGNNDFQVSHNNTAEQSARGVAQLIDIIRQAPIEPGMPIPEILLVAPPRIIQPKGNMADKFVGAETRSMGFATALETVASKASTKFFDAADMIQASMLDGIHLDAPEHKLLGESLAAFVRQAFFN